jgi:transcriptional regulator with XRE-family HTH domain
MTGLSLPTVQQAEQDKRLTLQTLVKIASALGVDSSVVLGQQAPRRGVEQNDRAMMRALSQAVHDSAADLLPDAVTASALGSLAASAQSCWDLYWRGRYAEAGALTAPLVNEAAARLREQPDGEQASAWAILADAYRLAAYVSNLMGARDLAYAAIGHAQNAAGRAADDVPSALVMSARSWVYLRDARLPEALALAERAATDIEPRFSKASPWVFRAAAQNASWTA